MRVFGILHDPTLVNEGLSRVAMSKWLGLLSIFALIVGYNILKFDRERFNIHFMVSIFPLTQEAYCEFQGARLTAAKPFYILNPFMKRMT